ncbi:hypothetical protein HPP92_019644 [Vanilla planifolia]|uniref:Pentatricopeptide repeat-containing protein n=1 Tax=Vanilla planifolia TaxID=51239 RepID=A0A835Q757_VANPL|nr:hypothetical protein HPP92_019644 [Vanilla planifolia]
MACRRSFQSFRRFHYYFSSAFSQVSSSLLCCGFSHTYGYMFHAYSSLAQQLLDEISQPNFPDFHNVIRRHSDERSFTQVLQVYASMLSHGFLPNGSTLNFIIKACTALPALSFGWAVHAQAVLLGFEAATFIQNGIIVMYARFREIATARAVFDKLANKDVVSWTSIMSGYVQNGYPFDALQIFRTMRIDSTVIPDFIALVSALKACMDVGDLEQGSSVHVLVVKFGVEDEPDLLTTLIAMYAKCGQVHVARYVFDQVTSPEPLLWNAMISGYAKNGNAEEAVDLFKEMVARNVQPDSITLRSAILACAQVGCLEAAKWIWGSANANGFESDMFVSTAVIDMFAKCGSMALAHSVFESIPKKDVVVWSAIIMGYGLHGQVKEAIELFHGMILSNIQPNDVTYVGLLSACKHSGLVEEGRRYFYSMKEHAIEPRHQHYACLVDLLGRSGHLEEAFMLIREMPMAPKVTVWGALLNACRIYSNVELGKYAAEQVFAIEPTNAGHYVQLSNIYACFGMWKDVARIEY